LLVVVIVIALMATAALTFALLMQESHQTARQFADQQQSRWAEESAIATLMGIAALPPDQRTARSDDQAAVFVQSLEIGSADQNSALGGDSLIDPDSDWVGAATAGAMGDGAAGAATDWQASLSEESIQYDPAEPGFAIFSWQSDRNNAGPPSGNSTAPAWAAATADFTVTTGGEADFALRWGWTNESSKLHLARLMAWEAAGTPASEVLQIVGGLDPRQADLLLDWLDPDDQARPFGGEVGDYAAEGRHYRPANRWPATLDALLLDPQVTPTELYGRRHVLSIRLDDAATQSDSDFDSTADLTDFSRGQQQQIAHDLQPLRGVEGSPARDLVRELGWSHRLTVTSRERNITRDGRPQIPANHSDLPRLFSVLSARLDPAAATYVCLVRQYGVQEQLPSDFSAQVTAWELADVELDLSRPPSTQLSSLTSLLDSHVRIPQADGTFRVVSSPWNAQALAGDFPTQVDRLFDQLTTAAAPTSLGRIHWRLADPQLFQWIPGLSPETRQWLLESAAPADSLTAVPDQPLAARAAAAYQAGELSRSQWQILERELTDGGDVFSAFVCAHAGDYRAIRWAQVIVDASGPRPQQLYYREFMPPPPTLNAILAKLNDHVLATP
jgi:hypothetical protein